MSTLELNIYPKITIVTPNFNQVDFLEETIVSVLSQGYPNLEYIIIDGGSTDGSLELIKKYEKQLAYWVSEPDKGMYEAIQKGFDKSTGEIMAWINSDDMYHRNAFFTVAEIFSTLQSVNWLVGVSSLYDTKGRTVRVEHSRALCKFDFYAYDYFWIQQETCFWRRDLWEKVGSTLTTTLRYAGDFDLWLRFFRFDELYVSSALVGGFRMRGENQLSVDHIDDYYGEVNSLIVNEPLTDETKLILKKYERIKKVHKFLKRYKIIQADRILKRFRRINFGQTKKITYHNELKKFVISNNFNNFPLDE